MLNTSDLLTGETALANDIRTVSSIKDTDVFKGKPFDGVYFKKESKPEDVKWSYTFVKFGDEVKLQHNADIGSDCWLIVLFEEDDSEKDEVSVVYYQAYLGDPLFFAKNQVKTGSQGFVIKKSVPGFKIIIEMLKELNLSTIKDQLEIDLHHFEKS